MPMMTKPRNIMMLKREEFTTINLHNVNSVYHLHSDNFKGEEECKGDYVVG